MKSHLSILSLIVIGLAWCHQPLNAQRETSLYPAQIFQATTTSSVVIDRIDDTHVLYTYRDGGSGTSPDLKAVIGEVNASTGAISFGTPAVIESNNINHPQGVLVLSATQAVMVYELDGADDGKAVVLTLDVNSKAITNVGSTTSFGADVDAAFSHSTFGMVKLTNTTFAVAYSDNGDSDHGEVRIGTVSGTTVSLGSDQTFASYDVQNIWITALSESKVVITFEDDSSSDHGKAIVGDISGNTVTFGTPVTFNAASTSYTAAQAVSSTQFAVIYVTDDSNDYLYSKVGTVNGTSITFGGQVTVENGQDARDLTIAYLTGTEFILAFNGGSGDNSKVRVGEISGTNGTATISYNTADTFLASEADGSWVTALTADLFVIGYIDDASTTPDDAEAIVGTLASSAPTSATIAATAFLEGAWNGTDMNTLLKSGGLMSLNAPYDTINNHNGSELVTGDSDIPTDVVDWVLVELREADSPGDANDASRVGSTAGFLKSNGQIVATDGSSDLTISLSGNTGAEFFVVVYHRNHLPIMSLSKVSEVGGKYTIDLSASGNVYEAADAVTTLSPSSKVGLHAGDLDQDGSIGASDLNTWRSSNGVVYSYSGSGKADFNLDGVINAVDRNDFHQKNTARTRKVPK